jgi:hypothetical protein
VPTLPRFAFVPNPLLRIANRPERKRSQVAEERRPELPQPYEDPARGYHKLDEFVCLVQVILALDVVFFVAAILLEREDGGEVNVRAVERDDPDAEDLSDVYVEDEVGLVVCYCPLASCAKVPFAPSSFKAESRGKRLTH